MKKNRLFIVLILTAVLGVFAAGSYFYRSSTAESNSATSAAAQEALVRSDSPSFGPENAQVTIVEFLDPECEACRAMYPIVKQLLKEYEGKVRLIVRYMAFHGSSMYAASALEEARETGHFEKALEVLFENQPEWGSHHNPRPELIPSYLRQIGMSERLADRSYLIGKHGSKIERDQRDGTLLGVTKTPTFFVNGQMVPGLGYAELKSEIEKHLSSAGNSAAN